ncbi:MAG: S8 family serine peptidase [Acidobacteriota bacterium]
MINSRLGHTLTHTLRLGMLVSALLAPASIYAQAPSPAAEPEEVETAANHRTPEASDVDVVYEMVRTKTTNARGEANFTLRGERGALSPEIQQRAARPWSYFDEDAIYDEDAWSVQRPGGEIEYGYRVTRGKNPTPVHRSPSWGPPEIDPSVDGAVEALDRGAKLNLNLKLRNMPEWDVPLLSPAFTLGVDDLESQRLDRRLARDRRAATLETLAASLISDIERAGGDVLQRHPSVGWITVAVPPAALDWLVDRQDLALITSTLGRAEEQSIDQGDLRDESRTEAARFWNQGHTGERSNSTRHGFGDITVAVVEPGYFEDEACAFYEGANCTGTSRIQERFRCDDADGDGNLCEPTANFPTSDEGSHGTKTAGAILGDYTDNQGCGQAVGDSGWVSGCHSNDWERRATGMTPEARLIYFGGYLSGFGSNSYADAFDDSIDRSVDMINNSWGLTAGRCNEVTTQIYEEELENAFDDGILVVTSAGNNNGATAASCNVNSPADVIKSLTINAFDTNWDTCDDDYNLCPLAYGASARGGGDAIIDGVTYANALTMIDLVAPGGYRMALGPDGAYGESNESYGGTSSAAPIVTGLAALVKDWYLSNGLTWINSPGRLHTVMLAMGDRHFSPDPSDKSVPTLQRTYRAGDRFGLGRVKLRLLDSGGGVGAFGNHMKTRSFTSGSSDFTYVPFSNPMPAGTEILKCVTMLDEDMSSKNDISRIDLEMRLRQPVNGSCSANGAWYASRIDASRDSKRMTALEDGGSLSLAGKCPVITLDKRHVTSQGITTHTMCYYAARGDDE